MANIKISELPAATVPLVGTELFEVVQSGVSSKVSAEDIANTYSGTLGVANGGTGAATLTGYVKGSGTSAMTASPTIPYADLAGRAYLSAYSDADQTGSISAATAIKLESTDLSQGITVANNGSGNPTRITFAAAGVYSIAASLQFNNSDSSDHDVIVWGAKNGINVPSSSTAITVPKAADGGNAFFQIVFYLQVAANDYVEALWLPESALLTLAASPAGAIAPAIPSAIIVAERIA